MTGTTMTALEAYYRVREKVTRMLPSDTEPGTPQPQLRIPPGDLSLPIADGGRRQRLLRRSEGFVVVLTEGQPLPDTAAMAVWRDDRSRKGLTVIASLDHPPAHVQIAGPYYLLHASMSYPDRLPEWWEVSALKDVLYGPDQDACMMLPRQADWVNLHDFCLHLWQLPAAWGIR